MAAALADKKLKDTLWSDIQLWDTPADRLLDNPVDRLLGKKADLSSDRTELPWWDKMGIPIVHQLDSTTCCNRSGLESTQTFGRSPYKSDEAKIAN